MHRRCAHIFLPVVAMLAISCSSFAQSLTFGLKTGANINFAFLTVQEYQMGKTIMDAATLNIESVGTRWDLYVGATTTVAGQWDVISAYSPTYGTIPQVDILKLQFRNLSNTSLVSGFFSLSDVSAPVYIIGTSLSDLPVNCPNQGTNTAGSYLTTPACYKFKVDMRITPGFNLRPGLYSLRIDYYLVQDL